MQPEHLAELKGKMFQEVMDAQRLGPCVMWNYNAAKNGGEVPMTPTEDEIPMGQVGQNTPRGCHTRQAGHSACRGEVLRR